MLISSYYSASAEQYGCASPTEMAVTPVQNPSRAPPGDPLSHLANPCDTAMQVLHLLVASIASEDPSHVQLWSLLKELSGRSFTNLVTYFRARYQYVNKGAPQSQWPSCCS